jgi:predicted methyltransferase
MSAATPSRAGLCVLQCIGEEGNEFWPIVWRTRMKYLDVGRALDALERRGYVKSDDGFYTLTDAGRAAIGLAKVTP